MAAEFLGSSSIDFLKQFKASSKFSLRQYAFPKLY